MKSDSFDTSWSGDDVSHLVKNAAIGGCVSHSVKHVGSEGVSVSLHSSASDKETCFCGPSAKKAWSFIRQLPVESILGDNLPRIVQGVPQPWKPLLQKCAGLAMRQILKEPLDPAGWKLLCLFQE